MATAAENARTIFFAAVERTPAERCVFLDEACGGNAQLRQRVDALLRAHDEPGAFLSEARPEFDVTVVPPSAAPLVGAVVAGRYKLLEEIGTGGMGAVWVAEQIEPVRRKVALKLIKAGMDSKPVLARFEAERQALALMDHPNIAKVLDGGLTETGRPFFVMDYVKGVPITEYCDALRLSIPERLRLFAQVCQAVQHAHQKGIIHRDLKPSNILVALYDDRPVVKVIDFGLAKAMHQSLTERTLHTAHETVLGTPLYMSPEQALLNNLDVDTRSDIYSLGVLLYELLTGSTPLEKQRFKQAAWDEVRRIIREEEPPRPSLRLSSNNTLASLAAGRQIDPASLPNLVRGELDWIVMKSLEKDRARRYETASGLAMDIQRYLTGEPVLAAPPSARYRLRKFAAKHRTALTTASSLGLLLVAGAAFSTWQAVRATRAERAARDSQRAEADRAEGERAAKLEAVAHAKEAEQNAEWAEKNAGALSETSEQLFATVIDSEIRGVGLKVDLELAELRMDPRVGLLRLARPLQHTTGPVPLFGPNYHGTTHGTFEKHPKFIELREFVTAAVLAAGQTFAPLVPPIIHDGQPLAIAALSPDHQMLLTLGKDQTARLWDTRTGRPIADLRQGSERVVNCGFSADGRTAFTDDQTSVVRFWDMPSGRFRTATEARPNRYDVSDTWLFGDTERNACEISASRLLTRKFAARKVQDGFAHSVSWDGPVELWDTATGRLVARLDTPERNVRTFQFLNDGRWITAVEGSSTVLVLSAENGKEIARLDHETKNGVYAFASPTGRRIATLFDTGDKNQIRIWNTDTWKIDCAISDLFGSTEFITDDLMKGEYEWSVSVRRCGEESPLDFFVNGPVSGSALLNLVFIGDGRIYDGKTWQKKQPPAGHKYHPDLAKFALDGRFVPAESDGVNVLIDTLTEKHFPTGDSKYERVLSPFANVPGFGLVATAKKYCSNIRGFGAESYGVDIHLIPTSNPDLPPELLELWAQVAVRGELSDEGRFVAWDEPTWEQKRQELAAAPAPNSALPFPGYVAADKLHWLRQEYQGASDADKPRLAAQLLDRAEAAGDKVEAVRWRAVLAGQASPVEPKAPQ
jgi:serine/threonine protein kinase/WD40 repeat protein